MSEEIRIDIFRIYMPLHCSRLFLSVLFQITILYNEYLIKNKSNLGLKTIQISKRARKIEHMYFIIKIMVRDFTKTTIWFATFYGYPLTFIFENLTSIIYKYALYDAVSK